MKILFITVGTRGDVQPFLALGRRLSNLGHTVTVCTHARYEGFVTDAGLGYAHLNNELLDFIRSEEGRILLENSGNILRMIRTAIRYLPSLKEMQLRMLTEIWESTRQVDPDLIVYHPKAVAGRDYADRLAVPCIMAIFMPMYVATGTMPSIVFPNLPLGPWYRRMTHLFLQRATWWGTRSTINNWRREHDLPARSGKFFTRTDGRPLPIVHAYSQTVSKRPADWPESAAVSGYWFREPDENWEPPTELAEFLASGPPPLYVGFGSMLGREPKRLTQIVIDAIKATGVRAVLAEGWGGLVKGEFELPPGVLMIDAAPHEWLFPRCAAVVHHGGCGTTAAGLAAGCPTLVCSFFGDQPFWGKRVHAIGAGPKPLRQKSMNTAQLADGIRQIISDQTMRNRAQEIAAELRREDGIANAIDFINRWAK